MIALTGLLVRGSLLLAVVAALALALAFLLLRHRPAARHRLLLGTLLLGALSPLWLTLATAAGAGAGAGPGWMNGPRGLARELIDPVPPPIAAGAAAIGRPVSPGDPGLRASQVAVGIWVLGAGLSLLRLGHGLWRTRAIRARATPWNQLFPASHPLATLDRAPYPLLITDDLVGAAVLGVRRPAILIGRALAQGQSVTGSLRQVLVHETAHARRRDPLWGLIERLVQAIYWFHPAVWLLRAEIARAREEACDDPVLAAFPPAAYARTLLALAATDGAAPPGVGAASARTGIQRRIRRLLRGSLSHGTPATTRARLLLAGGALALVGGWSAAVLTPSAGAAAPNVVAAAAPAREAPDPAFAPAQTPGGPPVQGAFVLHDVARGSTLVINDRLARQRLTPASTFKMIIALAGLEAGAIPDAHTRLRWNGQPQGMAAWNQDHDLASAMRVSATWYFQDVLDRLQPRQVQSLMQQLGYGNQDTAGAWRSFWIDGGLRISPVEQAQVMSRLLSGPAGVQPRSRELLDQVTLLGRNGPAALHGKTGTAESDGQTLAWLVGYVRGPRPFAYATLMVSPGGDSTRMRNTRRAITESLLVRHGALAAPTEAGR